MASHPSRAIGHLPFSHAVVEPPPPQISTRTSYASLDRSPTTRVELRPRHRSLAQNGSLSVRAANNPRPWHLSKDLPLITHPAPPSVACTTARSTQTLIRKRISGVYERSKLLEAAPGLMGKLTEARGAHAWTTYPRRIS